MFQANMIKNREALEAEKSATVLFHEEIEEFDLHHLNKSFKRFERAAAKGHEESIWILSLLKDVEMEEKALKEVFANTEQPFGYYFAGKFSGGRERFDFYKKSAERGCSWGQVEYGRYFWNGEFVEKDEKVYVEWLEKATNQNNPKAMVSLGHWFRYAGDDEEKAVSYYRAGADLGWTTSMGWLVQMLRGGEGCAKDLRQAAVWSAKGSSYVFWEVLYDATQSLENRMAEDLDCDFNQLCYTLGCGLYWYRYGSESWNCKTIEIKAFGNRCLDYYCSCVELQQESIFTFLLCWKNITGMKDIGQMIAKMVWNERTDNLLKPFTEPRRTDCLKQIKK